jgi:type IV secretory pathway VirD2 relaxase
MAHVGPHVHVALRGVDGEGLPLQIDRDYIKNGIREVAEDL